MRPEPVPPITRRPLREQIYEELIQWIDSGAYAPAERLRDFALAEALGVSRTPVREALLRLEREGIIAADQGRGFKIRPFSAVEVREKYPIVWTLECLALRTSPPPGAEQVERLRALNQAMSDAQGGPARLLGHDTEWHAALLERCGNAALLEMIGALKTTLRRYELAYMRESVRVAASTEHHARILEAYSRGELEAAQEWLRRNWEQSLDELSRWLAPAAE